MAATLADRGDRACGVAAGGDAGAADAADAAPLGAADALDAASPGADSVGAAVPSAAAYACRSRATASFRSSSPTASSSWPTPAPVPVAAAVDAAAAWQRERYQAVFSTIIQCFTLKSAGAKDMLVLIITPPASSPAALRIARGR